MWELIPSFILRNEDYFHRSAVSEPCVLLYELKKNYRNFLQFFGADDVDIDIVAASGGQKPSAGGFLLGSMPTLMGTPA